MWQPVFGPITPDAGFRRDIWPIPKVMRAISFLTGILLLTASALGQTTQPAGDAELQWERTVSSLGAAIAAHDQQSMAAMVGGDCRLSRFFAGPDQDTSPFFEAVLPSTVLGDHAYTFPANAVASDIARDVNSSSEVSDFAKKSLNLTDKSGRSIAMQWMAQSLGAVDGEFVGIIVTWDSHSNLDDEHRLEFVLVKGREDSQGFTLTRIVYGDPLQ